MATYVRKLVIPDPRSYADQVTHACGVQLSLVETHIKRLVETRDRYECGMLPWAEAELRRAMWVEVQRVLDAILAGKTVPPS